MKGVYSQAFFVKKQQKPGRHSRGARVFSEMDGRQGGAQGVRHQAVPLPVGVEAVQIQPHALRRRKGRQGEVHGLYAEDPGKAEQPVPVGTEHRLQREEIRQLGPGGRDQGGRKGDGQAQHRADASGDRLVDQGAEISPGPQVAAGEKDIVGAAHDEHTVRPLIQHIPAKTGEHTARRVAGDPPVHQRMARPLRAQADPAVPSGDAVAIGLSLIHI